MSDRPLKRFSETGGLAQPGDYLSPDARNEEARRAIDAALTLQQDPSAAAAAGFRPITNPATDIGPQAVYTGVGGGRTLEEEAAESRVADAAEPGSEALNLPATASTPMFGEDSYDARIRAADAARVASENAARGGDPNILVQANRRVKERSGNIERLNREIGNIHGQAGQDKAAISMEVSDQLLSNQRKADDLFAEQQAKEQANLDRQEELRKVSESARADYLDASQKLDPQRLIGPAGSRVMFVLSAALGALGQSLLGGRNNAVDLVNSMMEKDFEGQKARLGGKRENLSLLQQQLVDMRQAGMDERAAHAAVMSHMNSGMANRIAALQQQGLSAEQRSNGEILKKKFNMVADEWALKRDQAIIAAARKATPAKPMTEVEILKAAQEAKQREINIQKGEQDIAEAASPTAKVDNEAAKRQSILANRVGAMNSALSRIAVIEDLMNDASANPVTSGELLLPNAAAKLRNMRGQKAPEAPGLARQEIDAIASDIAASRGGPATDTDQAIGKALANITPEALNPATWGTGAAKERLNILRTLIASQRKALLEGQPAQDVAAVERDSPKPTQRPSTDEAAERTKRLSRKSE